MTERSLTHLSYEDINSDFCRAKYGDFDVVMMKANGYINATKLCTDGGRRFAKWLEAAGNKERVKYFENELFPSASVAETGGKIMIIKTGGALTILRGTYVHHYLIPYIAMWVSPAFSLKISKILDEWKKQSPDNEQRFWSEMATSFEETKDSVSYEQSEAAFRDQIALEENGEIEVETPVGFIDVLTSEKIIEVKKQSNWKHALGQIKSYGYFYPEKQKWIYLFDCDADFDSKYVNEICEAEGVRVNYL